jgi:hypothetical protein
MGLIQYEPHLLDLKFLYFVLFNGTTAYFIYKVGNVVKIEKG